MGNRKLAGSAQWRDAGILLQHGSIIVDDDQSAIRQLMREPADLSPAPATLREALGRAPDTREVADALFASVRRIADCAASLLSDEELLSLDTALHVARYRDPAWTWRQ